MTEAAVLADTPLFANLDSASLDALAESCSKRSLGRGDVLFHQDDESGALYIVVS
ncbi:MAG: CRP-like cAMP-binding protein, partial [Acidimicrobiales bacterium]